jgi:hypothetical protein
VYHGVVDRDASLGLFVVAAALLACGGATRIPPLTAKGKAVVVSPKLEPDGCKELGPVKAEHGSGCEPLGLEGAREGAEANLRNLAGEQGANYVRLTEEQRPHEAPGCRTRTWILTGVAYACPHVPD